MVKKIKTIGAVLIALIVVLALSAMHIVHSTTVDTMPTPTAKLQDNGTSAIITWQGQRYVDGYYIYQYQNINDNADGKNQSPIEYTVANNTCASFVVGDLQQASTYCYKIAAYKQFNDKIYKGEPSDFAFVTTAPKQQQITNCYSNDKGLINVYWTKNDNANGYYLKYDLQDGSASSSNTVVIKDSANAEYMLTDLPVGKKYSISVASFVTTHSGKELLGAYSDSVDIIVSDTIVMSNSVDSEKPMIALTFDDGPSYNSVTHDILDVLEKHNARATFFMVGANVADDKSGLKRKIALGCELGNHTQTHERYGKKLKNADILKCSKAIYKASGKYPTAFRSTGGITNAKIRQVCKEQGLPLYYWSIDTLDWQVRDADKIYNTVIKNVKDGDIILMHDLYPETAKAVERMVPELIKQGYQLVTVSELVTAKTGKPPKAGQQYLDGDTIKNNT